MPRYRGHGEYLQALASERAARAEEIANVVRERLARYVTRVEAEQISFADVSAMELADLLHVYPTIVKPLLVACNVGRRAVRRDLGFSLDTLKPKLTTGQAQQLADYLLPSLPAAINIDSLVAIDLYQWT